MEAKILNQNRYRIWDSINKKMITPEMAENDMSNIIAIGLHGLPIEVNSDSVKDGLFKAWNRHDLILLKSFGFNDKTDRELFEEDLVIYKPLSYSITTPYIVKFGWYQIPTYYQNKKEEIKICGWYLLPDLDDAYKYNYVESFTESVANRCEKIGNTFETEIVK